MHLIVVPDIFGITPELIELTAQFEGCYRDICIVDPYEGHDVLFPDERSAYAYFQSNCGLGRLKDLAEHKIDAAQNRTDLLGFSVGATCLWGLSDKMELAAIRQIVCFYGSRIREKTDISPQIPTTVIFPARERGFDIEPVIRSIDAKPLSEVVRTPYLHGFMNKRSVNFCASGYREFIRWFKNRGNAVNP